MNMKALKKLNAILIAALLISCSIENENRVKFTSIEIKSISDEVRTNLYFEMDTFIRLSNDVPLGKIERIIISDSLIYVLDNIPKVICFDYYGQVKFKIDKKGKGPNEFLKLIDFSIDSNNKTLALLDERQMKVMLFNSENGEFLKNIRIKFHPNNIKLDNNELYFYNPYTTVKDNEYQYSLISSSLLSNNKENKWIQHEEINRLFFSFTLNHFFDGVNGTYFINRMDNRIYKLSENSLTLNYQIEGLTFFDNSKIDLNKKSIDAFQEIKASEKFHSIQNFCDCANYIYFTVHKKNIEYVVLYDKLNEEVVFCSSLLLTKPTNELPLFTTDLIGNKNGELFGVIEPSRIIGMKNHPKTPKLDFFSNWCPDLKVTDNPIVVFYSIKYEKVD